MIEGIRLAVDGDFEPLFDPDQNALDITCEYCKSRYSVTREDSKRNDEGNVICTTDRRLEVVPAQTLQVRRAEHG